MLIAAAVRAGPPGFGLGSFSTRPPSSPTRRGWRPCSSASSCAIGISGRAPVTNMYESVIYVGLGVAGLGLILELIYRKRFILAAAAVVATLTLILADNCPAHDGPQPAAVAARVAQQLLAGHARDDHHAELCRLRLGPGNRRHHPRLLSGRLERRECRRRR